MMQEILVIIDPTQDKQPALERALVIRADNNHHLHLLLCDYPTDEYIAESNLSLRKLKSTFLDENRNKLKTIINHYGCDQNVSYQAYWNRNWYDSVIQVAAKRGSSLVFKSTKKHSMVERLLRKTSDINLIRNSPCPVWLVNPEANWSDEPVLLASVDLESDNPIDVQLKNRIIHTTHNLMQILKLNTFLVSATSIDPEKLIIDETEEDITSYYSDQFGIKEDNIIIKKGSPADVVLRTSEDLQASILAIGSVARKGFKAAVFGNTAEKILDKCNTDLLIVN